MVSCVEPCALGLLLLHNLCCFKKSLQQSGTAALNSLRGENFCKYVEIQVKFVNYTLLAIHIVSNTSIFESV